MLYECSFKGPHFETDSYYIIYLIEKIKNTHKCLILYRNFSSVLVLSCEFFFLIKKKVFSEIVWTIWKFVASCTYFKPLVGLARSTYPSPENKDQYQVRTGKSLSSGLDTSAWCVLRRLVLLLLECLGVTLCSTALLHCSVCAIYICCKMWFLSNCVALCYTSVVVLFADGVATVRRISTRLFF